MTSPLTPLPRLAPASRHLTGRAAGARLVRAAAPLLVMLLATLLSGCGLRLGEGTPASLPQPSAQESVRDALARHTWLISSSAAVVARSGDRQAEAAQGVETVAGSQLDALGGVWEPWASEVPTRFPTISPAATAAATATSEDLAALLSEGAALAQEAAVSAPSGQEAQLYASLAASWSIQHETVSPGSTTSVPRSSLDTPQQVSSDLLLAYDAARYACQEVAARAQAATRERAAQDAGSASAAVSAALAVGSEDTRLAAYASPSQSPDASAADTDVLWAQTVWSDVVDHEAQEAASTQAGSPARQAAVEATTDAALRAHAWGAQLSSLPGYLEPSESESS
ncbi:Tat pathway signal protein [Actinomyces wuliandei]|uniref:Tat pathway signal protein n=1 Tax=Actinomyces wuliandei TaxID=2057743 RepID=UPI001FA9596B|nr:Tat pathway signal protein [Actinomyces wuliandei]